MSETTREEEEVNIVQNNVEEVVKTREAVLQKKKTAVTVAAKVETETVNSNCDSLLTAKPRSTMRPLTTKPSGLSSADLDEFISLLNSAGEDSTKNELDQWKEMLIKKEEKPSKFKIDKNQLNFLLKRNESNTLSTLTSLKSPHSNNFPSMSFTFEGTPLGDVLRRNEANLNVASKEQNSHIMEQESDDVIESQNSQVASRFFENTEELSSLYVPFNEVRSQISIYEGLLELSLGEKFTEYQTIVRRWLNGNIDRKSYSQQIRRVLPTLAIEHHNEYILSIIKTSLQKETETDLERITAIYNIIDAPEAKELTTSSSAIVTAKPTPKTNELPTPSEPTPVAPKLSSKSRGSKKRYEDDDDDFLVITKSKKRKLIVSDDDDEEEPSKKTCKAEANKANNVIKRSSPQEAEENDGWSSLNKSKRKRKMVILSDDEDEDLSSLLDTRTSAPSVFDDPKTTINVKSTGLLKTTLTIKRNDDTNDSKASIIPKLVSQPVSKPILPISEPVSKPPSSPISQLISEQLAKSVSKPVKSSTDSSKISTKEAMRKASKERISKLVAKLDSDELLLSDPLQRRKYPSSLLDRLLSSDKKTSMQPGTSAVINDKFQSSSVKNTENHPNSTISVENQKNNSKKTAAKKTPFSPVHTSSHQRVTANKSNKSTSAQQPVKPHFKKPDNLLKQCLTKSIKSQGKNGTASVSTSQRKEPCSKSVSVGATALPSSATTNHQATVTNHNASSRSSRVSSTKGGKSLLFQIAAPGAAKPSPPPAPLPPPPSAATNAQNSLPPALQRTSKIIELLNRKTVVNAGQSNSSKICTSSGAQQSSSQPPPPPSPYRQQSALEKLLTAPLNGFKEASISGGQYFSLINGTAENNHHDHSHDHSHHHHHQRSNSSVNAHNFRKEASEKAMVVCKTEESEFTITKESPFQTYLVNGFDEGKDLKRRRIKAETDEEKAVEEVETLLSLKKTASYRGDVIYQLDEFDDDESVIPVQVTRDHSRVFVGERNGQPSDVIPVKKLPSYKRASLVTSCFDEVCLPNNQELSVRIVDTAARFDLQFAEKGVVPFVNVCLNNFMKNVIAKYASTRSAFSLTSDRVSHHIGLPVANPYIGNKYRFLGQYPPLKNLSSESSNFTFFRNSQCQMRRPEHLDAALRPKRYGTEKGQLSFSHHDQAAFSGFDEIVSNSSSSSSTTISPSMVTRYRSDSGCLRVYSSTSQEPPLSTEGSLRHLLNVLKTERSLIPNHNVYLRAVFRTISAISNSEEDCKAAMQEL